MSDERIRRIGENEALYRQVNEQVKGISKGMVATIGEFNVLCECGTLECMAQISVSPDVYEQARSVSERFIVLRGHQIDEMEAVIADHGAFYVIEKTPQEARRVAEEMDPRE
jgi:hypothetical protein